jgi:hypothetical protein
LTDRQSQCNFDFDFDQFTAPAKQISPHHWKIFKAHRCYGNPKLRTSRAFISPFTSLHAGCKQEVPFFRSTDHELKGTGMQAKSISAGYVIKFL